jgi:2-dehydro-3-deoxyphosphooctonate aldolase (KDO 8-P synthase)
LVIAAAKAMAKKDKGILNIKKGQFLSPQDAKHLVAKASEFLPKNRITITERGVSFGYGQLVVDMTTFKIIRDFGVDVIFDATHSVQMPGKGADGKTTGGNREMIEPLSMAAIAAGASGIFMEVYPDPTKAKSDGPNSYYLDQVPAYLNKICKLNDCVRGINS